MIVRTLITLALVIPAFWLAMRYNMHMFQLNVYMAGEQRAWLKKNRRLQWILYFAMGLGIVRMLLAYTFGWLDTVLDVLIWMTLAVIILVYRLMVEMNSKKPLKFTPRVKRMIVTIVVICLLITGVFVLLHFTKGHLPHDRLPVSGLLIFLVGSQI